MAVEHSIMCQAYASPFDEAAGAVPGACDCGAETSPEPIHAETLAAKAVGFNAEARAALQTGVNKLVAATEPSVSDGADTPILEEVFTPTPRSTMEVFEHTSNGSGAAGAPNREVIVGDVVSGGSGATGAPNREVIVGDVVSGGSGATGAPNREVIVGDSGGAEEPQKKRGGRKKKAVAPETPTTDVKSEPTNESKANKPQVPCVDPTPIAAPQSCPFCRRIVDDAQTYSIMDNGGRVHHACLMSAFSPDKWRGPARRAYAGIDPDIKGYVGIIDAKGNVIETVPMPTSGGDKPVYDIYGVVSLVLRMRAYGVEEVLVEEQQPIGQIKRPGAWKASCRLCGQGGGDMVRIGSIANFKKGFSYALWLGLLHFAGIKCTTIRPVVWKKAMGIAGGPPAEVKARAISKASSIWPGLDLRPIERSPKSRVPDGAKAECLMLSRYVMLLLTGGIAAVKNEASLPPVQQTQTTKTADGVGYDWDETKFSPEKLEKLDKPKKATKKSPKKPTQAKTAAAVAKRIKKTSTKKTGGRAPMSPAERARRRILASLGR
jgi:hypothetical protein